MFLELHILQNFAPANLNRDDTGAPKDCEFGGHRRARVSSQCLKRAIRQTFKEQELLPADRLAVRTKRVVERIAERLTEQGRPSADAETTAAALIGLIKPNLYDPKNGKTQYLLYLGRDEIERCVSLCQTHWDALSTGTNVPSTVRRELEMALDGGKAADLALFGRMLADLPERNVDAASQVAHALSTNKVSMEMDFYTAVDDLRPEDTEGADMLGTIEFNSACFYRYSNVDLAQLKTNLGGDEELARQTLEAYLRAAITAVPTGKQTSMAAHNPPSLVMAVARERGLWNLANAFVRPVWPGRDGDLIEGSTRALDKYWGDLTSMYGQDGITSTWVATLYPGALGSLGSARIATVDELVQNVLEAATFERANGRP